MYSRIRHGCGLSAGRAFSYTSSTLKATRLATPLTTTGLSMYSVSEGECATPWWFVLFMTPGVRALGYFAARTAYSEALTALDTTV